VGTGNAYLEIGNREYGIMKTKDNRKKRTPTRKKTESSRGDSPGGSLWLLGKESPFGMDVLDCRPTAQTYLSTTTDEKIAASFVANTRSNGTEFIGKLPENPVKYDAQFSFKLKHVRIKDGPLFVASCMEEKWNIYYYNQIMYFVRSWTGILVYTALCDINDDTLLLTSIAMKEQSINPRDPSFALREVFFLVVSHVIGDAYPHPVPARIGFDESDILGFSFSQYGRMGLFAAAPPSPKATTEPDLPLPLEGGGPRG
jgi:hypothetical protein